MERSITHRIAVDGGGYMPGAKVQNGIQRLIAEFMKEYLSSYVDCSLSYYYFSNNSGGHTHYRNISAHKLNRAFFATLQIPYQMLCNRDAVFLGFSGVIPKLLDFMSVKKVIFIYDFGFYTYPDLYDNPGRLKRQVDNSVKHADVIITLTHQIRQELLAQFNFLNTEKVHSIYAGIDHLNETVHKKRLMKHEYFLYVGVVKPVKNIMGLLELFLKFTLTSRNKDIKLVIVGAKELNHWMYITNTKLYKQVKNRVVFLENISDRDLTTLYMQACALINISFAEGFCYPVLEALSLGTPAITNNLPLYAEFKPHFPHLHITKTEEERLELMQQLSVVTADRKRNIPTHFTWKNFTKSVYELIKV